MSDDIASPSSVASTVNDPKAKKNRQDLELKKSRDEGFRDGVRTGHQDLIDWLQDRYMGSEGPERGTPQATALLTLARDASNHFKALDDRAKNKRRHS